MSAERKPHEEPSRLAQPLAVITRIVVRYPRPALLIALGLAAAGLLLALTGMQLRTSRLDLLNPRSGYNKLWLNFIAEFGEDDDTVIVVDGPDRATVVATIDRVAAQLARRDHLFRDVLEKIDLQQLRSRRLHYLSPEQLTGLDHQLARMQPVLAGDWTGLNLGVMFAHLQHALQSPNPSERALAVSLIDRHSDNLLAELGDDPSYQSPWTSLELDNPDNAGEDPFATQYFLANEGRTGLVLLRLAEDGSSLDGGTEAIDQLRAILDQIAADRDDVQLGLTGLPVMENDEMRASESASIQAGIVSLVGVACLFVAGFGGIRHPLMTVAALLLALAWTFGYITLSVGHLNILSMSFGVILIGLGIDFGVHYVARYLLIRQTVRNSDRALIQTASSVGPGILTGGATTALAFFTAGLSDFTGIAELGIIAGGGIVLCVVAALCVLPALIQLSDCNRSHVPLPRPLSVDRPLGLLLKAPRLALGISLIATALLAVNVGQLRYDHNLLNLQPVGLESVVLEKRLLDETDASVWFALSIADSPETLRARQRQFEQLETVSHTEEIISVLPPAAGDTAPLIAQIGERLADLPKTAPLVPVDAPADLAQLLAEIQNRLAAWSANRRLADRLPQVVHRLRSMPTASVYARLSRYQQRVAGDLLARLKVLAQSSDPRPPGLHHLPPALVARYVGRTGQHLLKIFSKTDIWDMDALQAFVTDVRQVDPQATGKPLQTFEASRQMQRSYIHAALYSLVAVSIVLVLDFRSIRYSLLALSPVVLGLLQLFGILALLDIPLNPANMIVLPLVLGIGIDDGVHVLHDFRQQRGRFRLSRSTATAVIITSLTTMVGFGSLMIADHRGLESLGRVLTIGVSCCLFSALVPLPAYLYWRTRNLPTAEEIALRESPEIVELGTKDGGGVQQPAVAPVHREAA